MIVIVLPERKSSPSVSEAREHFLVQELVTEPAVERLDEGVLRRLAGRDVMPGNAAVVLPLEDGSAGQFCSVVADDGSGLAVEPDDRVQFARDAGTRERGVGDKAKAFARCVVDDGEDAEAPRRTVRNLVREAC